MRFLKSCGVWLLLLICMDTQAQDGKADSTVLVDTVATTADPEAVFHFDTIPPGTVPLVARTIPESTLRRLHQDDAFWYANAEFKKKTSNNNADLSFLQRLFQQTWFRNLLWCIIIGAFIVVMVLFLIKSDIALFRKKAVVIQPAGDDALRENIFALDYESGINQAKSKGDFRAAIRYYFLQTLSLLSQKNLIQYKEDFTNSDYLMQLRQSRHYGDFKKLTHHFEYTWYGQFPVTTAAFKNMEADFSNFKNSMDR